MSSDQQRQAQERAGLPAAGQRNPGGPSISVDIELLSGVRSGAQDSTDSASADSAPQPGVSAAPSSPGKDPAGLPAASITPGSSEGDAVGQNNSTVDDPATVPVSACGDDQKVDLLKGKTDVYACAVRGLLCCKLSKAVHMFFAMVIVCFVQLTLLTMLLMAAWTHSTQIIADPMDYLQVQANTEQLQLCGLLQALHDSNITVPQSLLGTWDSCSCLLRAATSDAADGIMDRNCTSNVGVASLQGFSQPFIDNVVGMGSFRLLHRAQAADTKTFWQAEVLVTTSDEALQLSLLILLSMGVLAVFVVKEVTSAAQLAYAIAASMGVLPLQYTALQHRNKFVPIFANKWRLSLAYVVPTLQIAVAVLAFCAANMMLALPQFLTDITQYIVNSVALAFIIEIDDKAGDVLMWMLDHGLSDHDTSSNRLQDVCYAPLVRYKRRVVGGYMPVPRTADCCPNDSLPKLSMETEDVLRVIRHVQAGLDIETCTPFLFWAWLGLRLPVVLGLCSLMAFAYYYSYAIIGHIATRAALIQGSASFMAGYCLVRFILTLLFLVLLCDHPLIVPKVDDDLDSLARMPNITTTFITIGYTTLCRRVARTSWAWLQVWSSLLTLLVLVVNVPRLTPASLSTTGWPYIYYEYCPLIVLTTAMFPEVVCIGLSKLRYQIIMWQGLQQSTWQSLCQVYSQGTGLRGICLCIDTMIVTHCTKFGVVVVFNLMVRVLGFLALAISEIVFGVPGPFHWLVRRIYTACCSAKMPHHTTR